MELPAAVGAIMAGVLVAHRKHRAEKLARCWDQLTQVHSEFRSSFYSSSMGRVSLWRWAGQA